MDNNQSPNFAGDEMKLPTQKPDAGSKKVEGQVNSGLIIAVLFFILALILGGLYYWYSLSNKPIVTPITPARPTAAINKEPESTTAYAEVHSLNTMSTSDELDAIEADLLSTELSSLENEMTQIEAELEASI